MNGGLHHGDGTSCAGVTCAWKGDGAHEMWVATYGRLNVVVESSGNVVLQVTNRERWTLTDIDGLRDALSIAKVMAEVTYPRHPEESQ